MAASAAGSGSGSGASTAGDGGGGVGAREGDDGAGAGTRVAGARGGGGGAAAATAAAPPPGTKLKGLAFGLKANDEALGFRLPVFGFSTICSSASALSSQLSPMLNVAGPSYNSENHAMMESEKFPGTSYNL